MSVEELEQEKPAPSGDEQQDGQAVAAEVEQEVAPAEQSDDAAFQAGFDTARTGGEPEPEPEPPKLIAGFTEEEVKALLQKASEVDRLKERESKVFGSLGALRQAVDALKAQPSPQAAAPVNIALKRLSQEYPEMAESLMEDLKESLGGVGGQSFDPMAVDRIVSEKLESTSKSYELKLLSVMHPDWKTIPESPEFAQWKGTLAPDELQIVNESWDAIAVGDTLTKFKAWKTQTSQAKQNRQSRLEAAATPTRGARTPTPSLTENDAFVAGWKSVHG